MLRRGLRMFGVFYPTLRLFSLLCHRHRVVSQRFGFLLNHTLLRLPDPRRGSIDAEMVEAQGSYPPRCFCHLLLGSALRASCVLMAAPSRGLSVGRCQSWCSSLLVVIIAGAAACRFGSALLVGLLNTPAM